MYIIYDKGRGGRDKDAQASTIGNIKSWKVFCCTHP